MDKILEIYYRNDQVIPLHKGEFSVVFSDEVYFSLEFNEPKKYFIFKRTKPKKFALFVINCPKMPIPCTKRVWGKDLMGMKHQYKESLTGAILHIFYQLLQPYCCFFIGTTGMDYNGVQLLLKALQVIQRANSSITCVVFLTKDNYSRLFQGELSNSKVNITDLNFREL